jgi:6-pyruvoyltetrahydropterin/6-carboxytetrahydropterin synthase
MHGHGYTVCIAVEGEVDPEAGWLIDYQDMVTAWMPLHNQLDHQCLNDVDGLSNSTSEALAFWIWQRLKPQLPQLCEVAVSETSSSCCRYCGE